jgi:hypothetical protein
MDSQEREAIKQAIRFSGLNQATIASRFRPRPMSHSWLSQLLTGARQEGSPDQVVQLAELVQVALEERVKARGGDSRREAVKHREELARIRLKYVAGSALPLAPPGQLIPSDAPNFIQTVADRHAVNLIQQAPCNIYLTGPPHGGKSSILAHVGRVAQNQGALVAPVDCKLLLSLSENGQFGGSKPDSFGSLAKAIAERMIDDFQFKKIPEVPVVGSHRPDQGGAPGAGGQSRPQVPAFDPHRPEHFKSWVSRLLKAKENQDGVHRVLLIDGLDRLSYQAALGFLRTCRGLENDRSFFGYRFSMGVSYSLSWPMLYYAEGESPSSRGGNTIEVSWFDKSEVAQLTNIILPACDPDLIEAVWACAGGQPFLTHALLSFMRDPSSSISMLVPPTGDGLENSSADAPMKAPRWRHRPAYAGLPNKFVWFQQPALLDHLRHIFDLYRKAVQQGPDLGWGERFPNVWNRLCADPDNWTADAQDEAILSPARFLEWHHLVQVRKGRLVPCCSYYSPNFFEEIKKRYREAETVAEAGAGYTAVPSLLPGSDIVQAGAPGAVGSDHAGKTADVK